MMQTLVEIDMSHLSSLCNQKEGLLNAVLSKSGWTEWLERLAIRNSLSMHCTRVKFWFGFGKAAPDKNAHERTMKGKTWRNKEAQETMEEPRRRKTRGRRQATGSQGQETPWVLEESELGQDRTGNWRNHGRCQEIKSWSYDRDAWRTLLKTELKEMQSRVFKSKQSRNVFAWQATMALFEFQRCCSSTRSSCCARLLESRSEYRNSWLCWALPKVFPQPASRMGTLRASCASFCKCFGQIY